MSKTVFRRFQEVTFLIIWNFLEPTKGSVRNKFYLFNILKTFLTFEHKVISMYNILCIVSKCCSS